MSGLTAELVAGTTWVPLAVLTASVLGSAHCAGMCGPLVLAVARGRAQGHAYHAGRLLSYAALGALAGALGERVFGAGGEAGRQWLAGGAAVLMAAGFVALGVSAWRGGAPHVPVVPRPVLGWLYRKTGGAPALLGALSAALPCGWLHSFVLAAVATQSATRGAGLMAVFWLGTMPVLSAVPWLSERLLAPVRARAPRLTAVVLISVGLAGLGFKLQALRAAAPGAPHHCALMSEGR